MRLIENGPGDSLFSAVQTLGLKLERRKAPSIRWLLGIEGSIANEWLSSWSGTSTSLLCRRTSAHPISPPPPSNGESSIWWWLR